MTRRFTGLASRLLLLVVAFVVAIAGFSFARSQGWLSPFGLDSESRDSQVIGAIERTQEVSLLSLDVQGIREERANSTVFGQRVPGSGEEVFLQYNFAAKLGVDGAKVEVTKTGERSYRIAVPEFVFIGYDQPTFKVITEGGGILSGVTDDIDKVEVINKILNDTARDVYLAKNRDLLEDQTEMFYDGIFSSVDPALKTTYEFDS